MATEKMETVPMYKDGTRLDVAPGDVGAHARMGFSTSPSGTGAYPMPPAPMPAPKAKAARPAAKKPAKRAE